MFLRGSLNRGGEWLDLVRSRFFVNVVAPCPAKASFSRLLRRIEESPVWRTGRIKKGITIPDHFPVDLEEIRSGPEGRGLSIPL